MDIFTAKADAGRSAMAGRRQVASAPHFPGEGNEFFTAEGDAWRQAMTRGQVPAASVAADDHGGMTHKCDGCSGGAPCGSCGGNVSRTSPAYQALGWGMMQAASNGTTDPFWKAATVAQALRDAPGRTDSAEWNAIESMVDRTQALYTVGTQGMNAAGAMLGAWPSGPLFDFRWRRPDVKPLGPRWDKPRYRFRGPIPGTKPGSKCCIKEFVYPVSAKPFIKSKPNMGDNLFGNDARIGIEFTASIKYFPKGEGELKNCDCSCCEFEQFILNPELTGSGFEYIEDCRWVLAEIVYKDGKPMGLRVVSGGKMGAVGSPEEEAASDAQKKAEKEYKKYMFLVDCPGDKHINSSLADLFDDMVIWDPPTPGDEKGICGFKLTDKPSIEVRFGRPTSHSWIFKAVINDTCRNIRPLQKREFHAWVTWTGAAFEGEPDPSADGPWNAGAPDKPGTTDPGVKGE